MPKGDLADERKNNILNYMAYNGNGFSARMKGWMIVMKRVLRGMRHGLFLLPALLALLLFKLLPHFPHFTETVFSRGIFRVISVPLGGFLAVFPVSFTELLVILALPLAVLLIVLLIRRLRAAENRGRVLARAGKGIGWVLSFAALSYMLLHGANFYRLPAAELMGLDTTIQSPEYLQQVCIDLARRASAERENLSEDEEGCTVLSVSKTDILRLADEGYRRMDDTYPFLWGGVWRAKPVMLSHWWSYTGITGMYFPMLVEANVNIDVPDSEIPATAAHELAHTRGFAREDECNFFAYLTATHSDSADFRYSGYLMAYIYCSNALYDYDTDMWAVTREYCSEGVKRDLGQRNAYWDQFEGEVQDVSSSINNGFIASQGDEAGIFSYDRVVQLIVGYYRAGEVTFLPQE